MEEKSSSITPMNQGNWFLIPKTDTKDFVFPIPHKPLGMPMLKGIERWGTLVHRGTDTYYGRSLSQFAKRFNLLT